VRRSLPEETLDNMNKPHLKNLRVWGFLYKKIAQRVSIYLLRKKFISAMRDYQEERVESEFHRRDLKTVFTKLMPVLLSSKAPLSPLRVEWRLRDLDALTRGHCYVRPAATPCVHQQGIKL
jgi:hypothetical protein